MEAFEPFRVLGSICSDVPISATMLYGTPLLMVATGHTYQLYKGKGLAMLRGGPTFADRVVAVAQSGKYRFVAEGPRVHAAVHHKPLWTDYHESVTRPMVRRLLAQDDLLFVLGEDKRIAVREARTGTLLREILAERSESITCLALLPGYANKLLAATEEGTLHLYNYKTGACLWYRAAAEAEARTPILSLATSRYRDLVAYGTGAGAVVVLNVATDEVVTRFEHQQGAVTALAFRLDKDSLLAAGTSLGEVVVWDLENRCLDCVLTRGKGVRSEREVLENAHVDTVHSLVTFDGAPAELAPLLVTGGSDNALMQYRFDTVDGLGVLVRERRGHMGGCTAVSFYNGDLVATAGTDRAVRVTHVFSDRAAWELSQGKLGKKGREQQKGREDLKMPPATAFASSTTRNYQWASLVSIHAASAQLCGWRMDTRAQAFKLSGLQTTAHTARAVAMSDCGNFAVVGYSSGNVCVMNVQNRSLRQLFDPALGGADRAHEGSVECVQVACGNTTVVTAALDGHVKLWRLHEGGSRDLRASFATGQPITTSCLHQGSSLLLVAQHFTIRGYHCNPDLGMSRAEMRTPVREFVGHTAPITAMAISPDTARYVASTSGDGALLLWDLAAAACVAQYRFAAPATSLSFHPDALFLATTHAGERGAFLWVNHLRYGFVPEVVPHPASNPTATLTMLHFPTAHGAAEEVEEEEGAGRDTSAKGAAAADGGDSDTTARVEAPLFDPAMDVALRQRARQREQWAALDAVATAGLRLSGLPRGTWWNLTVVDQIAEKNQPLLPPKRRDAPFFLPTTQGLRPTFLLVASDGKGGGDPAVGQASATVAARVAAADLARLTPVQEMLVEGRHDDLMAYFLTGSGGSTGDGATVSAQAIDLDIKRAVDYVEGVKYTPGELDRMAAVLRGLLRFAAEWLRRGENVDLVQGIVADVVRTHGPLLARFGPELAPDLQALAEQQGRVRYSLDHLVSYPSTLAGTFSGSLL